MIGSVRHAIKSTLDWHAHNSKSERQQNRVNRKLTSVRLRDTHGVHRERMSILQMISARCLSPHAG